MKLPLRQDKSRKGGWECDLKPFVAITITQRDLARQLGSRVIPKTA
jgi:hypothetical protein